MKAYTVYYLDQELPKGVVTDSLKEALDRARELRNAGFRHVVLSVEDPNNVGKLGVDDVGPDYNWTKRR